MDTTPQAHRSLNKRSHPHLHQFVEVFLTCQADGSVLVGAGMDQQFYGSTHYYTAVGSGRSTTALMAASLCL